MLIYLNTFDNWYYILHGVGFLETIHFIFTSQERTKLNSLRKLIERKQLCPVIDRVLPLDKIANAHQLIEQGGTRGKLIIAIATDK